jgi:hypothetical protein
VDLIKQGNPHAIRFVVRKPSTSYMKNIFLITFNLSVWVASVVVLAVFAAAVNIILNWETRNKQVSSCRLPDFFHFFTVSQKVKQNKYGVSDVTLIALEAVCQQGCVLRANKNREREEFLLQELRPNLKVSPVESWP